MRIAGIISLDGLSIVLNQGSASAKTTLLAGAPASNITVNLPTVATTLIGTGTTDTLTNKTINATNNTISNLTLAMLASGVLNTSTSLTGATDSQVPSALAAKTYADGAASAGLALKADKTITITAGVALSGGGDLSANRTIDLEDTAVTPASYGSATQVAGFTVDQQGRLTAAANTSIQITQSQVTDLVTDLGNKQPLDATLTALAAYNTNGLLTQTAADTFVGRTITGTANRIVVTDGNGVSGNPTFDIGTDVVTLAGSQTLTNKTLTSPSITTPTGIVKGDVGLGNVDNTSDATKNAAAVVLTNKDFDGGTASDTSRVTIPKNTFANLLTLTRKEGTILYATDLDTFFADDGTNLTAVGSGSGSGSGQLNIVDNPSAASATTGWTNGTSHTGSRDTSNSPLAGVVDTCFAITASAATTESATSGFYAASLACPAAIRSTKLQLSMYVTVPATSLGVWRLSVYNSGGTRVALSSDSSSVTTLSGGFTGQFNCTFDADTGATYTVSITQTTRSSANTLYMTNIVIGNGIITQGAAVGSVSGSFTPDATAFGTITNAQWDLQRNGSDLIVEGRWTNGTVGAVDAALTLPTGLTIDSTRLSANASGQYVGLWFRMRNTAGPYFTTPGDEGGILFYDGSTTNKVFLTRRSTSGAFTKDDGSEITGTSFGMTVQFRIPIAEWAGNGTVNLGQGAQQQHIFNSGTLTTAGGSDTTNFAYGPQGVAIQSMDSSTASSVTTFRVRSQYPIQAGSKIAVEVSQSQSGPWIDVEESGLGWTYQARARFGVRALRVSGSTTDIDVQFGNSGASPSSGSAQVYEAQNVDPWSNYTSWFWRVTVFNPSSPVGFSNADSNSAGLVKPRKGQYSLTVTGTGWTTNRAQGLYYQDQDGNHRLKFNLSGAVSAVSATTLTITGVTFKNFANHYQALAAFGDLGAYAYTTPGASTIYVGADSGTSTNWRVSGDVELESKPSWA